MPVFLKTLVVCAFMLAFFVFCAETAQAQSLGNAGTIQGAVLDESGAAMAKAEVRLQNPVTGYSQSVVSGGDGEFQLLNIPPNPYHLEIKMLGFAPFSQDVTIRNS